jgi:hypothetical protein
MPFPLAHPAAVLPFRRYCPAYLSFPALVAGSVSPDLGYAFGETGLSDVAHTLWGGLAFGVIASLLMLLAFYGAGPAIVRRAPMSARRSLVPLFEQPLGPVLIIILSACVGVLTHLLFDSFTHSHGWLVLHVSALRAPVFLMAGRPVRVCHVLWYLCSFAGIAFLIVALGGWQDRLGAQNCIRTPKKWRVLEAVVIALLVFPIEVLHHLVRSGLGLVLVGILSIALIIAVLVRSLSNREFRA